MVVVVEAPNSEDAYQQGACAGESVYVSDPVQVPAIDLNEGGYWTTAASQVFLLHSDEGA